MSATGPAERTAPSLRRRLLRWAVISTVLIWILAGTMTYRQANEDVGELIDAMMAETAQLVLSQVGSNGHLPERLATLNSNQPRNPHMAIEFQVGRSDGTLLLRTAQAPRVALDPGRGGYADIVADGSAWRSLVVESADRAHVVQLFMPDEVRDEEALEIAWHAILPLLGALPLMLGLLYLSVRRGLKPLDELAADVAHRSPDNLAALDMGRAPGEARPLVGALNRLLARVQTTLDNERRFTADAAHELRTPLAALKIHTQVALATDPSPATRAALEQVLAGADRATRLVEQLLRLARLDPIDHLAAPQRVDLGELAASAIADAAATAAHDGHTLHARLPGTAVTVTGDADLLAAALRNLIDNALRYTPRGSTVTVSATMAGGSPAVTVEDDGPGVPADDLPRLSERFFRGSDPGAEGSGLGLAIVSRIADLHGARLAIGNLPAGGFAARLTWPSGPQALPQESTTP